MKDSITKRLELWFRRLLIQALGSVMNVKRKVPNEIDYNSCKILFLRQDLIGDVLVSTPLFAALHNHYQGAIIDVLLGSKNYFILDNDPIIRKRWRYRKNVFASISLLRAIRKEKYDFVVDLMDNPSATSTILILCVGARWKIGIEKENSFVYDITVPLIDKTKYHIVDRLGQLLTAFKINPENEKYSIRYYVSEDSSDWAGSIYKKAGIDKSFVLACNISAGSDARYWGTENYRIMLSELEKKYPQIKIIVLYKPEYRNKAEIIVNGTNAVLGPVCSSFDRFAALIKNADLLITPDTAAVHLAAAFKIPAVIFYVPTTAVHGRIWEPYGTKCKNIVAETEIMSTIPVKKAISSIEELINNSRHNK